MAIAADDVAQMTALGRDGGPNRAFDLSLGLEHQWLFSGVLNSHQKRKCDVKNYLYLNVFADTVLRLNQQKWREGV
jgi:hypothetical protein